MNLCIADMVKKIHAALNADVPLLMRGPPGVGKSAIAGQVAKDMGVPMYTLIASLCEPSDFGGMPVVNAQTQELIRYPLGAIKALSKAPGILFLDEITNCPPLIQAALMRGVLDRVWGDTTMHPDSRLLMACNSAEQSAGGFDVALPLIGRMEIVDLSPLISEVQAYFFGLGKVESTLRSMSVDFAATLEADTSLLQIDPPKGSLQNGNPWGAPRAWERALRSASACLDMGERETSNVFNAALRGNVGTECASAFMAIRKIRNELPSLTEITEDPVGSKLPKTAATGIASLGLLAQVALKDPCPAWIYSSRLSGEAQIAAFRSMLKFSPEQHKSSKWYQQALKARATLLGKVGSLVKAT